MDYLNIQLHRQSCQLIPQQLVSPVLISLLPPLVSLHQLLKIHTHQPLHCQIPSVPVPPVPLPASSVPAVSPPCEPPSLPQAAPTTIPAVNPAAQQDLGSTVTTQQQVEQQPLSFKLLATPSQLQPRLQQSRFPVEQKSRWNRSRLS